MARSPRRDDEDALDPVEAADQPVEGEEELDGFSDVDADDLDPDLDDDATEFDEDAEDGEDLVDGELAEDDDEATVLPSLLEDDEIAVVVAEAEDDDDEDTLRDGEFVCRSCFMAKRESALADAEAMLCRDCA